MAQTIGSLLISLEANTAKLDEQIKQSKAQFNSLSKTVGTVKSALVSLGAAYYLSDLVRSVADATVTFQGWQYTLEAGGLSAKETASELDFLQSTAQKLGISIKDTGSSFSRLILTGRAAGMSLTELNDDFAAATAAMRIFHLSNQQTTRSWLALTEVMSMGKLQSRQFTQQLGRDWPGIGALIAKTMFQGKDSLEQFQAAMKAGEISSRDFMDAFVKLMSSGAMKDALAGAEDSLQAAMGRFQTAWFNLANQAQNTNLSTVINGINELTTTLNDPAVKQGFDAIITGLMNVVKYAALAVKGWTELANLIGVGMAKSIGADDSTGLQGTLHLITQKQQEIANLQQAIKSGDPFDYVGKTADQARAKIALLQQQIALLQRGATYEQQHPSGDSAPAFEKTDVVHSGMASGAQQADTAIQKLIKDLQFQNATIGMSKTQVLEYRVAVGDLAQAMKDAPVGQKVELYNQLIQSGNAEIKKQMESVKQIQPMVDSFKKQTDQMSQYAIQAARNIQSILGDGLYQAMNGKFDNIFQSFADMIKKMIAQIVASKILDNVFGTGAAGSGQSAIAAFFGGSTVKTGPGHAAGGPVSAGTAYPVGEKGPEWFMPSTSGTIIPNGGMGGNHYNATFHIDAKGADSHTAGQLMALLPVLRRVWLSDMQTAGQRKFAPLV
jgi:tape measure domain-containing protein